MKFKELLACMPSKGKAEAVTLAIIEKPKPIFFKILIQLGTTRCRKKRRWCP